MLTVKPLASIPIVADEFIVSSKDHKLDRLLLEQGVENRDEEFISDWVLHKLENVSWFVL